jgi:serpin B
MRRLIAPLLLTGSLLLVACGGAADPAEPAGVTVLGKGIARAEPQASASDVQELTRAQRDFAVDLYRTLAADTDEDLALGPGSLHTALSMVRAGARGTTAREMDDVLHTGGLDDRLHELGNTLDQELESRDSTRGISLDTANRVWAADGLELADDYVETLATHYGAGLASLDFAADAEAARAAVNEWVHGETGEMIEELFPPGTITPDTLLVLANALHLTSNWKFPFKPERTTAQGFTLVDGSSVQVETMHYDEYLPSGRGPGWQAVRLPYSGEQLSMTVIVPDDLEAFEQSLDADLLARVDASIKDQGIHLSLPRFTARTHSSLVKTLAAMGMPTAFGGGADFSGMTGSAGLFIGAIEHEAVVEVDEKGTEAAAASGVSMLGSHGPTVTVDRPFLFLIEDEPTGAVLFLGRVMDPR